MKRTLTCLALLSLVACDGGGGGGSPNQVVGGSETPNGGGAESDAGAGGSNTGGTPAGGAVTHPDLGVVEPPEQGLERRAGRMQIEQIRRSIETITGGLTWEEDFGNGPTRMLDALGPTMGEPDYLLVTEENMEPSLIIAKFMQDASHRVCTKWVAFEAERPVGERTLVRHGAAFDSRAEADVKAGLRALQLRFFARFVPDDASQDATAIAPLHELFETASGTSVPGREARDGWLAVCIALMSDPEMVVY